MRLITCDYFRFISSTLFFTALERTPYDTPNIGLLNLHLSDYEVMTTWDADLAMTSQPKRQLIVEIDEKLTSPIRANYSSPVEYFCDLTKYRELVRLKENQIRDARINSLRCSRRPLFDLNLRALVKVETVHDYHIRVPNPRRYMETSDILSSMVSFKFNLHS